MFLIYGKNCVNEAIRAGHKIYGLDIEELADKKDPNFKKMLKDKNIPYQILPKKTMDKKYGSQHQGFGASVEPYRYADLQSLISAKKSGRKIFLVLDGIEDPHNLGAMIRSCDAFSIDGIIIPKNRSVSITETVAHVSTGAIEYVPICMVNNLAQSLEVLKKNNFWVVGTDASAKQYASDIDKNLNIAVIIGSEGFGISKVVKNTCDYYIQIPMTGHVNSLNASVSCGIILALLK
ncbi:MAG: 23S rRNA (guanosine(2251)-2'-O)-methyltransferase RlmB [Acholeplasmatales bacterium]|nr:23S rRNA (guanosine(2251)-2'-O)-methyltransferase RlmB [Acholeplasmatales bacterium]